MALSDVINGWLQSLGLATPSAPTQQATGIQQPVTLTTGGGINFPTNAGAPSSLNQTTQSGQSTRATQVSQVAQFSSGMVTGGGTPEQSTHLVNAPKAAAALANNPDTNIGPVPQGMIADTAQAYTSRGFNPVSDIGHVAQVEIYTGPATAGPGKPGANAAAVAARMAQGQI